MNEKIPLVICDAEANVLLALIDKNTSCSLAEYDGVELKMVLARVKKKIEKAHCGYWARYFRKLGIL
jgi:hypothetical protein